MHPPRQPRIVHDHPVVIDLELGAHVPAVARVADQSGRGSAAVDLVAARKTRKDGTSIHAITSGVSGTDPARRPRRRMGMTLVSGHSPRSQSRAPSRSVPGTMPGASRPDRSDRPDRPRAVASDVHSPAEERARPRCRDQSLPDATTSMRQVRQCSSTSRVQPVVYVSVTEEPEARMPLVSNDTCTTSVREGSSTPLHSYRRVLMARVFHPDGVPCRRRRRTLSP